MESTQVPRTRLKLNKGAVERKVKSIIEKQGGTYLSINWKKNIVHFITPQGMRKTELLMFSTR